MTEQPTALRLIQVAPYLEAGEKSQWIMDAAVELQRLLSEALRIEELAYEQHTEIYGLRLQVLNLQKAAPKIQVSGWTLSEGTSPGKVWISDAGGEGGSFEAHELAEAIGAFYREKF